MRPKALVAFTGIILLLACVDLIPITCPTCRGIGDIDIGQTSGMENVQIVNVDSRGVYISLGCGEVYGYALLINVSVVNGGPNVANGYLEVAFLDPGTGEALAQKNVYAHIPAKTKSYISTSSFIITKEFPKVSLSLPSGRIICPNCNKKGEISLFTWLYTALTK